MAVTAKTNDPAGVALDVQNTALTTDIAAAPANSVQYQDLVTKQKSFDEQIVLRQLATGRLSAATVLAASVFGSAGSSALSIPSTDVATTALQTRITALSAAIPARGTAGWQTFNQTQSDELDEAQRELLATVINKGYGTAANILAASL